MSLVENSIESSSEGSRNAVPVAVIDIGTTSIRMAIAEIDQAGDVRILETLTQAVNLGTDTFTTGSIRKATIEECVRVLKSYRQLLEQYQITSSKQIRVVATSAVREANNRLAFIDRIYVATGIEVEPIDEAEVNRITYLGILPFFKEEPALAAANTLVVEVGGGSTEFLLVQNGNVTYSHTYRLGSLRLRETLEQFRTPGSQVRSMMEAQIKRSMAQVHQHVPQHGQVEVIALGGDIRFAASQLSPNWTPQGIVRLNVAELETFAYGILDFTADQIVRKYHLTYPDAETLGPALLAYVELAKAFELETIVVTIVNLRDGLLQQLAAQDAWTQEFSSQIIRSAIDLGRKFHFDEPHATHTALLATKLFDELIKEHQLESRFRVILHIAALLHEIGQYVSTRSFHKHSMYLISNSDLFGLSQNDVRLVAQVARYHRRAAPKPSHQGYAALNRDERIAVYKMAALLRVAIALDDSRSQRIHEFQCEKDQSRLIVAVPNVNDLSLEQLTLEQNGWLFEEVFGLQVLLRTVANN